jgi:hypothetical protein
MRLILAFLLMCVAVNSRYAFSHPEPSYPSFPSPYYSDASLTQSFRGRWLAECIRFEDQNQSRYYGIEFNSGSWSTFVFDFRSNSACIGMSSPNDGRPLTYRYDRVQYRGDGWIRIEGTCLNNDNGCTGRNTVDVYFDGDQVFVRLVDASSIWFEPGLVETVYPSGPF